MMATKASSATTCLSQIPQLNLCDKLLAAERNRVQRVACSSARVRHPIRVHISATKGDLH